MNETDDTTETMGDVSHTNPYTGRTAGQLFSRGPTVAADGGEPDPAAAEPDETDGADERTGRKTKMRDVDHTPPNSADDANRVFERGVEHGDSVEDEE
ncbi:hypothetical protein [Natrinema ejinorense]|uniref:Uncharacterized protein n=1 Tax=Natrinema ejinorense TaxID=373386 RepID=A0A2A5QXH6_9EURY|nr:hypothetical protein [Natrinema ejinorense]PCR91530.1 hypothetical protein CP557_13940 [Natrinema ejinorense]